MVHTICCVAKKHCSTHDQHGGSVALSLGHPEPSVSISTKQQQTRQRIIKQSRGSP